MPLSGTLSVMSLADLLQWVSNVGKTGTLEVERNKVVRKIIFKEGHVIACSSDEPAQLLGHYLLSRGKLSEEALRTALAKQEASRQHLGQILVDMHIMTMEELGDHLANKAEETIFSIFDWEDASFRFHDQQIPGQVLFPVDLRVEEILLRGAHRYDEMKRIRAVFNDPGIVLRLTGKAPPEDLLRNRMARRIHDLINGDRSVAEILLHAHASEYQVYKLLFEMFRAGHVKIETVVCLEEELEFPPDEYDGGDPVGAVVHAPAAVPPAPELRSAPSLAAPTRSVTAPAPGSPSVQAKARPQASMEERLVEARHLVDRAEYESAIEILDALYRAEPNHDPLRRLLTEAEIAFVDKAYKHYLPANKVPVLARSLEDLSREQITPAEFFLLSRIDGVWNLKSIIQVSPLREVDALRAMKRMREKGFIELRDP